LTKTDSLDTPKSSPEHSTAAEAETFRPHRLLQNQKSLTKTDSLQTRKSSPEHSSPAEAEIRMAQAADAQILTRTQFYGRS
jgi:hypothetical protein